MDDKHKRQQGYIFFDRMVKLAGQKKARASALEEFRLSSYGNRIGVALGLLAIGADYSEPMLRRIHALSYLGMIIRACGLMGNETLETGLTDLVDRPILERSIDICNRGACRGPSLVNIRWLQSTALIGLVAVNKDCGLQKIDQLLEIYGESEFGRELRKIRERFS